MHGRGPSKLLWFRVPDPSGSNNNNNKNDNDDSITTGQEDSRNNKNPDCQIKPVSLRSPPPCPVLQLGGVQELRASKTGTPSAEG